MHLHPRNRLGFGIGFSIKEMASVSFKQGWPGLLWLLLCCFLLPASVTHGVPCKPADLRCPEPLLSSRTGNKSQQQLPCRNRTSRCDRDCSRQVQPASWPEEGPLLCCRDPRDPCRDLCLKGEPKTSLRCPLPRVSYVTCQGWQLTLACSTHLPSACPEGQSCCPGPETNCQRSCQRTVPLPVCDLPYSNLRPRSRLFHPRN